MRTLIAYHGDSAVKTKYLTRVRAHREADRMVSGVGWDGSKGCAVGCTLERYDHAGYETELGVPRLIASLQDSVFEGLARHAPTEHLLFPEAFLDAIPVGADLSLVWPRFAAWMLTDPECGVIRYAGSATEVRESIQSVSDLYVEWITIGVQPNRARWAAADAAGADAADAAAARATFWRSARDTLLELLRSAPIHAQHHSNTPPSGLGGAQ